MYIFRGENNEPHPYHVKSEWELPIQRSVALEVSGCDGPTEKLSSFVDKLLQPIAQQQKSYLKDTTDFVNFIENTKVPAEVILVSMDVTSLYTNIPQEEGIDTVCRAYEIFYRNEPPIPTQLLKRALRLILQENSFQFNGKNCLQTHFSRMRTSQNLDIFCEIIYFNLFLSLSLHFFFFISSFVARFIVFFAWNCGWLTF